MNPALAAALAQAIGEYRGGSRPIPPPAFVPASVSIKAQTLGALKSLEEPEALPNVTPAGAMQIERKGEGAVQELVIGPKRAQAKTKSLDGNISNTEFERVW